MNAMALQIRRILHKVDDLPTLPTTVLRISELVNNPQSSAKDLAQVITDDQVLTARLLKLVNSAFYGFPQRISTVTGAIVLLGFDAIRHLLLSTSLFEFFSGSRKRDRDKRELLWDHSLGCAVGAKVIAKYTRYEKVEELFVAGLLHDIGKIVEMLILPELFADVVDLAQRDEIPIIDAERTLLGFTHADVGKMLAKRWNLPTKLVRIIAHHHEPESAGALVSEACVVHLADILCRALDRGWGGDDVIPALNLPAWEQLHLDRSDIEPIMEEMEMEYEDVRSFCVAG